MKRDLPTTDRREESTSNFIADLVRGANAAHTVDGGGQRYAQIALCACEHLQRATHTTNPKTTFSKQIETKSRAYALDARVHYTRYNFNQSVANSSLTIVQTGAAHAHRRGIFLECGHRTGGDVRSGHPRPCHVYSLSSGARGVYAAATVCTHISQLLPCCLCVPMERIECDGDAFGRLQVHEPHIFGYCRPQATGSAE